MHYQWSLLGPQTKKSNLTKFSSDYCSMFAVPKYFLNHPETESAVTFLTDKRILLFARNLSFISINPFALEKAQ